jgi:PleD family two-component response regulator
VAGTTDVPFDVTISIGVAELGFDEPALSLLTRADKALYAAKLGGRDQVAAAS